MIPRRFVPAIVFPVFVFIQQIPLILLRKPNLLVCDVVLLDCISKPCTVLHIQEVMENWFSYHVEFTVLTAVR